MQVSVTSDKPKCFELIHQLNKAEIGVTDESILDWISGSQDTFSSIKEKLDDSKEGTKI